MTIIRFKCLIVLLMFYVSAFAKNTDVAFKPVSPSIKDYRVQKVIQDSTGIIWMASSGGLFSFDGVNYIAYPIISKDKISFDTNWIYQIEYHKSSHSLILFTLAGVYCYQISENKFIRINLEKIIPKIEYSSQTITDGLIDNKGRLWLIYMKYLYVLSDFTQTSTIHQFTVHDTIFSGYDLKNDFGITAISTDGRGNIFAGSTDGLFHLKFGDKKHTIITRHNSFLDNPYVSCLYYSEKSESLWCGGENVVANYQVKDSSLNLLNSTKVSRGDDFGFASFISYQDEGRVWLGSPFRLHLIENIFKKKQKVIKFGVANTPNVVPSTNVSSLMVSQNNTLWVTCFDHSMYTNSFNPNEVQHVSINQMHFGEKNANMTLRTMALITNEKLLLGSANLGLFTFDTKRHVLHSLSSIMSEDAAFVSCSSILPLGDKRYLLGTDNGLFLYNHNQRRLTRLDIEQDSSTLISNNSVISKLIFAENGSIWMLVDNRCLLKLNSDFKTSYILDFEKGNLNLGNINVNHIMFHIKANELFLSTLSGLQRIILDDQGLPLRTVRYVANIKNKYALRTNQINYATPGQNGEIWLGTIGAGLIKFEYDLGINTNEAFDYKAIPIMDTEGEYLGNVKSVEIDEKGNVWFTSNKISCYHADSQELFHFDRKSGVSGSGFLMNSILRSKTNLYFLNSNHLNWIDINYDFEEKDNVRIILFGLNVMNRQVKPNDLVNGKVLYEDILSTVSELKIPNEIKKMELTYTIQNPADIDDYTFFYRVEGLSGYDEDWIKLDKNALIFTGLRMGKYLVSVKLKNKNGVFCDGQHQLILIVEPPLWLKPWFIIINVIVLFLMVLIVLRVRTRTLEHQKVVLERTINKRTLELSKKNIELEKVIENRNRFLSIIGHDLKNPFSTVLGFSDYLRTAYDEIDNREKKKIIDYIYEDSNKLYNLLENLLEWGNQQRSTKPQLKSEEIHLQTVCDEVIEISTINTKNISILNRLKPSVVVGDKDALKLILRNLIGNAVKFSKPESKILVDSETSEGKILVSITDFGVGMDEHTQENLFNFNTSVSHVGTGGEKGSGIGLINSKALVEGMGGELSVNSVLNHGTTITFSIPAAG